MTKYNIEEFKKWLVEKKGFVYACSGGEDENGNRLGLFGNFDTISLSENNELIIKWDSEDSLIFKPDEKQKSYFNEWKAEVDQAEEQKKKKRYDPNF